MKTYPLPLLAVLLIAAAHGQQISPTQPRPAPESGATGERFARVFIARSDKNGDGFIDQSEFRGGTERFVAMDTNKNGVLDPPELLPLFRSRLNDPKSMQQRLQGNTPPGDSPRGLATTPDGRKISAEFVFERLDTDRDRFLTVAEFSRSPGMDDPDKAAKTVAKIDGDNDGKLSWSEFDLVFQQRHAPKPSKLQPYLATLGVSDPDNVSLDQVDSYLKVFARIDTDADGNLSHKEYVTDGTYLDERSRNGIFRASDSDSDGTVTRDEYIENRIITDEAKAIMARADTDSDGTITLTEFLKHPDLAGKPYLQEIFKALDTNHDGKTTTPEYLRVWGQWARNPRLK